MVTELFGWSVVYFADDCVNLVLSQHRCYLGACWAPNAFVYVVVAMVVVVVGSLILSRFSWWFIRC